MVGKIDKFYDWEVAQKKKYQIPLSGGAWDWYHVDEHDKNSGFGERSKNGQGGTYFYYIEADPEKKICDGDGFIKDVGVHTQARFRDLSTFRSFFPSKLWLYEAYAKVDTTEGTFKAGKIWRRFGLDWDNSFWGPIEYFDGFKLNPDWGFSWEGTHKFDSTFTLDYFGQFYVHQDGVNGSLAGADSESEVGRNNRNISNLRILPKISLTEKTSLELGLSGMEGEIYSRHSANVHHDAYAFDLSAIHKFGRNAEARVFGEFLESHGTLNLKNYVTGGPSDRAREALAGFNVRYGPVTYRVSYSEAMYAHPSGHQKLWLGGVTLAISKNIDLYVERVRWDATNDTLQTHTNFDNGWELALNWRF